MPYDFIITKGINLIGPNVLRLPDKTINTQDYIAASRYVIAKGGWSTVSEILLQHKMCCLLKRGYNSEDETTECYLERRHHCIMIEETDLYDIGMLINRMKRIIPNQYKYYDSTEQVCNILLREAE